MQEHWIAIYSTDQFYQAEFTKDTLQQFGIEAVIMNQKDSSYHFGEIMVMVNVSDQEKAIEILKSVHSGK